MATTLRKSDSAAEVEIAQFLDMEFYPKYATDKIRCNNADEQMMGLDVIFDYGGIKAMKVDEKTAAHYVNKDLPTFAFEVNFLRTNGELTDGWFFDQNKVTDYYLLVWAWATKDKGFSSADITKLDVLIINRQKIIDMLAGYNLTHIEAANTATELRRKDEFGAFQKFADKPFYFFYSPQLAEKPVNIIIKKSMLLQLAIGRHIVVK